SVKKLIVMGLTVTVETGAGTGAYITDAEYMNAGARIAPTAADAVRDADILFKVRAPEIDEIAALKPGVMVVALLSPFLDRTLTDALARQGAIAFAMEFVPRI